MFDLREFVDLMSQYAGLEHDHSIEIKQEYPDGSLELEIRPEDDDSNDSHAFRAVIADGGEYVGHQMILLREEPPIMINAVPAAVVAVLLEL